MNEHTVPTNLRVQVGDEYAKFFFDPVDGAAGYILSFYRDEETDKCFRTRVTEKPGKLVRGFVNNTEYYVSICAFVRDEECNEIRMDESERVAFTPISDTIKVPKKICLRHGERARINYEYSDEVAYPTFESNNTSVVTVNDSGEILAFKKGEADIIITFPNGASAVTSVSVDRNYSSFVSPTGRIIICGDLMCNAWMQRKAAPDNYDFSPAFKLISERLKSADHVIGNLETVVYDNAPFEWEMLRTSSGTSNCNSPSTFLRALKDAGFDILVTSNNHSLDCGSEGLKETISLIKRIGLYNSGTYYDNPIYFYSAGIRIALISMTMISNLISNDVDDQILGHYSEDHCRALIKEARNSGAEYVIVYMHWGNMNEYAISDKQKKAAQFIADNGADLIVGCHPHLVQKATYIETFDRRNVPCIYSLGNFSTSMKELTGNRDAIALILDIERKSDKISTYFSYLPVYSRILHDHILIEPVDHPLGYDQMQSAARIEYVVGPELPVLKPKFQCFGSVILRKILKDVERFDSDFSHILLSPASLAGRGDPEYATTDYTRVNTDISKEKIFNRSGNPNDYCIVDFYAAASLKLLKLDNTYYTFSDAFVLSDFYKEHESEFSIVEQPDATDICTQFIEKMALQILSAYDHDKIILIRSRIPDVSVVDASVYHTEKSHIGLNRRIEWLEDLFIIYADPVIIDISREYFTDNTESGSVSEYEEYYYKDVLNILDKITDGDKQRSFSEPSAELWYRRVMKYYKHVSEKDDWDTICNNKIDAASDLIRRAPLSFISEHSSEIIYLREHHIDDLSDVPFLEYMSSEMKAMAVQILEETGAGDQSGDIP